VNVPAAYVACAYPKNSMDRLLPIPVAVFTGHGSAPTLYLQVGLNSQVNAGEAQCGGPSL
jgi:hypothetical protein